MRVFNLLDTMTKENCSLENQFGWFWCLDERYIPRKHHGGCHRVYQLFKVRLKNDESEMFVAYNSNGEPILDSSGIEDLVMKIDLYDFQSRYQG